MSTRLTLVCHAWTSATRSAAFPRDEPLDARGTAQARAAAPTLPPAAAVRCGPEQRTRQTAAALGLTATLTPPCRIGRWGAGAGAVS